MDANTPRARACSVMIEPIMTKNQALIQKVRACFDPITASHLSEHALARLVEARSRSRLFDRRPHARSPGVRAPDFPALLGPTVWKGLPAAVQGRFACPAEGSALCYPGAMTVEASPIGWVIAQACRLLGTPLAPWTGKGVAVDVTVRRDGAALVWDRLYHFPGRAPVRVSSRKIIDAREGLLEVVRGGLGMALTVSQIEGGLLFQSRYYFLTLGSMRIPIPHLLTPGVATVIHKDLGGGRFLFSLAFVHPWLGRTLYQEGEFRDPPALARSLA